MTVSRGGVVMQGAWNTGAQYLPELVFILKSFVRSVSHFLDSLPAHSGTRTFHFFSLSFCTVILSEPNIIYFLGKSMLQPKENLCLFVSCFYFWGTPYTWAYAMLSCIVILPFYCIAEPCIKRMSTDIVWLKILALACAAKKKDRFR